MKKLIMMAVAAVLVTSCSNEDQPDMGGKGVKWDTTPELQLNESEAASVGIYSDFGIDFINAYGKTVSAKGLDNFALSPLSAAEAVAMLANVTSGPSRDRIVQRLGFDDLEQMNTVNLKLMRYLPHRAEGTLLTFVNSFWYAEHNTLSTDLSTRLSDYYMSPAMGMDFADKTSIDKINAWASDNTGGLITDIVNEETVNASTAFILANALYFKGDWASSFDKKDTKAAEFVTYRGSKVTADFMNRENEMLFSRADDVIMASLPYKGDEKYMDIVLPPADVDFYEFVSEFDASKYRGLVSSLSKKSGKISIPRFDVKFDMNLNDILTTLGILTDGMDFSTSGIIAAKSVTVKQFNAITVNEQGTEMASVTTVTGDGSLVPQWVPKLVADRPFMFFVRDAKSGIILMSGGIIDPTLAN